MKTDRDHQSPEAALRRSIRDLVAMAALPTVWAGSELAHVADDLAGVLYSMLDLDLIFLRIHDDVQRNDARASRARGEAQRQLDAAAIETIVAPLLTLDSSSSSLTVCHVDGAELHANVTRFGQAGAGSPSGGVIVAGSRRVGFPSESDRLLLGFAATQVAMLQDRRRSEARLREEAELFETMHQVGSVVAGELDLEKLVQAVTDAGTKLVRAQFGAFFYNVVREPANESYMLFTLSGAPREAFASFPMPRNTQLFGPTFRGEGIVRIADVTKDPRYGKSAPHHGLPKGHLPVRSYLAAPVISRSGQVLGGLFFGHGEVGVFTERSERLISLLAVQAAVAIDNARLYDAATKARTQAEAASKAKDDFLAMLSHELRTPMTPVLLTLSLLERRPDLPADVQHDFDEIRKNIELEARLIDDLLDLTRIARGKLKLDMEVTDIHPLIQSTLEICRRAGGPELTVTLDAKRHHVRADPARLQQILWNLLNNAHKFTPSSGRIEVRSLDRPDAKLLIEICDTGIGIDPQVLPRLFTAFEQNELDRKRHTGGLGLGLAISKALADGMGAMLSAASPGPGRGATFTLELATVAAPATSKSDLSRGLSLRPRQRGIRVLLVEDHASTRDAMGRLLSKLGCQIEQASDKQTALEAARRMCFDLVISDVGLPDGTGHELMRELLKENSTIKGIALSGYGMEADLQRSLEAGFIEHITKPVDLRRLVAVIDRVTADEPTTSSAAGGTDHGTTVGSS